MSNRRTLTGKSMVIAFIILLTFAFVFTSIPALSGTLDSNAADSYWKKLKVTAGYPGEYATQIAWKKLTKAQQKKIDGIAVFRDGKVIKRLKKNAELYNDYNIEYGTSYTYQLKTFNKTAKKAYKYKNASVKKSVTIDEIEYGDEETDPSDDLQGENELEYVNASNTETTVIKKRIRKNCQIEYTNGNTVVYHGSVVRTYLKTVGDNYMLVQGIVDYENETAERVEAFYFDKNYKPLKSIKIDPELPKFGGFYESPSNYYVVSGQENPSESDSTETLRITKYDKDWNRLGSCNIYGKRIHSPFDSGSCRMAMSGKMLYLNTCKRDYKAGDGKNHQRDIWLVIDTDKMALSKGPFAYVGHSFDQYIQIDGDNVLLAALGDASPRGINLACVMYNDSGVEDAEELDKKSVHIMEFPGAIGDNYTGGNVSALEFSNAKYLVAGCAAYRTGFTEENFERDIRDVYLATVDKNSMDVSLTWLTSVSEEMAGAPCLVKISSDEFMIMWTEEGTVRYMIIDGEGKAKSKLYSMSGHLSECPPIISNDEVVWFTNSESYAAFYSIPLSTLDNNAITYLFYDNNEREYFSSDVKDGTTFSVDNGTIKVTSVWDGTASFIKAKNVKDMEIPETAVINGDTFKITKIETKAFKGKKIKSVTIGKNISKISKNAFSGSSATKITIKTKKLKKSSVKGSLNNSKVKTIKVKVGTKEENGIYVKRYKKYFTKKNVGKKVTVK